jgi:hypothetical protein
MKWFLVPMLAFVLFSFGSPPVSAQGNIDWEELWVVLHPGSATGTYGWMAGQRQYTGLAYDKWRDVVYIVNPGLCNVGGNTYYCPKIHIWDAQSGYPSTTVGRGASGIINVTPGQAGQLPVPADTVVGQYGWPSAYGSFSQGQFPIYKVDLDDEGRIYACNLVSPIWGICFPGPPPNCDPIYLAQGPFRVYRWDTPWASPKRIYATLRGTQNNYGSVGTGIDDPPDAHVLSEMTWTRWGDAFDVVGHRNYIQTPNGPVLVDSTRMFTSGGPFSGQSVTNREINVLLPDTRLSPKISNGIGTQNLEFRLGIRLTSSIEGLASHGIAVTGMSAISEIWHDNNARVTTLNNQGQYDVTTNPFPQNIAMTRMWSLSSDEVTGTGAAGPLAYFGIPELGTKFLVCADGYPTDPNDPTAVNNHTRARVMNVTTTGQEARQLGLGDTPMFNNRILTPNSGVNNYIADVDYKLEPDPAGKGYFVVLFVLMSNNGIAAYRSRTPVLPVELSTFKGMLNNDQVDLTWEVTSELNNAGFDIQRSYDGSTFENVGFVKGRGTASSPMRYTYSDPVTQAARSLGLVHYRLRQVDTDGRSQLSPIVNVAIGGTPNSIALGQNYPNPFTGSTSITFHLAQPGFVSLKLFNAVGDEVATLVNETRDAGAQNVSFSGDALPAGTYMYQLNVNGTILEKKMVLMK